MSVLVLHLTQATVRRENSNKLLSGTVPAQYLYKMDETAYFMNTETYDQYEIQLNVENEVLYIPLENSDVKINSTELK